MPRKNHLARVRRFCLALPETHEKLSHGEPTFFIRKTVFAMFANNHHGDGKIAVWLPMPFGFQKGLIESNPDVFFDPPYVGPRGWVGIDLEHVSDDDLNFHIQIAWELMMPKRLLAQIDAAEKPKTSKKKKPK